MQRDTLLHFEQSNLVKVDSVNVYRHGDALCGVAPDGAFA